MNKSIPRYTREITRVITGRTPQAWNNTVLPGLFGEKAGGIRNHADVDTLNLIETAERETRLKNLTIMQAADYAMRLKKLHEECFGYEGPELSPAKLTPRVSVQIKDGKRYPLADTSTGEMPLIEDGRKRKELPEAE